MVYSSNFFEAFFLLAVIFIWLMIFYQLFFTFTGLLFYRKSLREKAEIEELSITEFPPVSLLIPAHNEALVIENTLESLLNLDYPQEKMEIIVINDGSTDSTAEIVEKISRKDSRVRLFNIPEKEAAKGKPHALNIGITKANYEYIAIYDADNTPEPASLRYLIEQMLIDPELAAVFGKFRTRNCKKNLLTRFINLETLSFQHIIQSGRFITLKTAILPGTNFVLRKSVLKKYGGWDEKALTEDTELSLRLLQYGERIKFIPYAVTWEEEPEEWRVWLRQRSRWIQGNIYIIRKYLFPSLRQGKISIMLELIYLFLLYYLFLGAILLSHLFFITCGLGLIAVHSPGPYFLVWVCAFLLFVVEIMIMAALEKEASPENFGVIVLMYFTYCQGWIILVFRVIYQGFFKKEKIKWEKTPRFASSEKIKKPKYKREKTTKV